MKPRSSALRLPVLTAILSLSFCSVLAIPQPATASDLSNLSTRLTAGVGDDVIITEFIVQGNGTETLLLRGLGPSLALSNPLKNPTMTLFDARGRVLDTNNDWVRSPDRDAIEATGLAPSDEREPAILHTFGPGLYTAVVRGVRNTIGVAVAEMYSLSVGDATQITGVGTRGFVGTGDTVLISGFIISGSEPLPILLRGLGPSLSDRGVDHALADPAMELYDGNGQLVALNDNWMDSNAQAIIDTGLPPMNELESAILVTMQPGAYTVIVRGLNSGTGTGFVQVYDLNARPRALNPVPRIRSGN